VQEDNQEDFLDDERLTYERYMKWKAPWLFEEYTDEIRAWFKEWYTKVALFPEYPSEEEGGSLLIANKLVKTPEQYIEEQKKLEAQPER
jgi:hypothetical protein